MTDEARSTVHGLVKAGVDLDFLFARAREQKVFQIVYHNVREICGSLIPPDMAAKLWTEFHENTRRHIIISRQLASLVSMLEKEGIGLIPFKGPVLAAYAYGNIAMREFGDIDVLVAEADVDNAVATLKANGYTLRDESGETEEKPFLHLSLFMESAEAQRVISFERDGIVTELHWDFTPQRLRVQRNLASLRRRTVPFTLNGAEYQTLSPPDRLLGLCLHGAKHYWDRLCFVCDVAEVLRVDPDPEWDVLLRDATAAGCRRIVLVALLLANRLFGAAVPDGIYAECVADLVAVQLVDNIVDHLLDEMHESIMIDLAAPSSEMKRRVSRLETYRFSFDIRERLKDRLSYLLYLLTKPTKEEWDLLHLPRFLAGLYYFVRPIRLLSQRSRQPLGALRRKGLV